MTNALSGREGDRRSTRRLRLKVPLRYHIGRIDASEHLSTSEDVSERGIFFKTNEQPNVGTVVHLFLEMPKQINGSSPCPWHCRGRVVRIDPISPTTNSHGVGVKFDCYDVLLPESPHRPQSMGLANRPNSLGAITQD